MFHSQDDISGINVKQWSHYNDVTESQGVILTSLYYQSLSDTLSKGPFDLFPRCAFGVGGLDSFPVWKAIQDSIPDDRVSRALVSELEFKHRKKNGASLLSYPVGLAFSPKHSRLFITDRLLHAVFMVGMHCAANVTLIAGGGEPGHTNDYGNKARFRNPASIAVKESGKLYVCDQGNGRVRVVNLTTLLCHASQTVQGNSEESQSEEEDYAVRLIRQVHVHDLSLISEGTVLDQVSAFAMSASAKESVELFVSDVNSSWQDCFNFWCCRRGGN